MTKTMTIVLIFSVVLIGSSMASLVAQPAQPAKARTVNVGRGTVQVPLHLPREVTTGTNISGSASLGSKDACDITFDRFTGIYWSDRDIAGSALLPTPAYVPVSEQHGGSLVLGSGGVAQTRVIKLSAEKPCGKIVQETLNVIDLYCRSSKTHYAVVGMQDPFMTLQKVVEIAKSLKCS
ncbi:MAG: hypothetical protein ACOYL3_14800 [Desulfuromonadaceae bacterium]